MGHDAHDNTDDVPKDAWGECPVCSAIYSATNRPPCAHLVTDWCFSSDAPAGGYWATDGEGKALREFDAAGAALTGLLQDGDAEGTASADEIIQSLPAHLRDIAREAV